MQSHSAVKTGNEIMGKVEYQLPDELGTLVLFVPMDWVGGRADNIDALWIDQKATGFKNNITLKIRSYDQVYDQEKLLDKYVEKFIAKVSSVPTPEVQVEPGRRFLTLEGSIENYDIEQHQLLMYAKKNDKCYLLTLTNTHQKGDEPVDLTAASII